MENSPSPFRDGPSAAPLPPLAPGLPFIGSALMAASNPLAFFLRGLKEQGPIFRFRVPGRSATVMGGPEANRFVAQMGRTHLSSSEFFRDFGGVYDAHTFLPGADGEPHLRLRRLLGPTMTRRVIGEKLPDVIEIVRERLEGLPLNRSVDVVPFVRRTVGRELGAVLAGVDGDDYFDDLSHVLDVMLDVTVAKRSPRFLMRLPRFRRAKRRVDELSERVLRHHDDMPVEERRRDTIDAILEAQRTGFLDANDVTMLSLMPYQAGLDTVSHGLSFGIHRLLEDRVLYERLTDEVDAAFASGVPSTDELRALPTLRGLVMETLRIHPVAFALMRHALRDFEFEGHRVEAGDFVIAMTSATHFMPELFEEPHRFDVERYAAPRNEHKKPWAYVPYAIGPTTCLGAGLADLQMMATIAALVRYADLVPHDPDYRLRTVYRPSAKPAGLKMRVRALRNDARTPIPGARKAPPAHAFS